MEFTGFCYSNSRVSPFYFLGNVCLENGRWGVTETQFLLGEYDYSFMPVIAARNCQEFFEDW